MTHKLAMPIAAVLSLLINDASASQSISSIAAAAAIHAESQAIEQGFDGVAVEIRPLDSRISLNSCGQPLAVTSSGERTLGPVSIAVSCSAPSPWTVHVRGTVSAEVALPVLAVAVNRGDIIGSGDIEMREQRIVRSLVGYLTEPNDIVGKEARKHLAAGGKLRQSDLIAPQIIDRGQTVDLVARSAGLTVNMQGKALANGAAGERLLVKNSSSGKRLEGLILNDGTVLIQ